eukprot:11395705-Alexandrium_andersonii.AAC.1
MAARTHSSSRIRKCSLAFLRLLVAGGGQHDMCGRAFPKEARPVTPCLTHFKSRAAQQHNSIA